MHTIMFLCMFLNVHREFNVVEAHGFDLYLADEHKGTAGTMY